MLGYLSSRWAITLGYVLTFMQSGVDYSAALNALNFEVQGAGVEPA